MDDSKNIFSRIWESKPLITLRTLSEIYGIYQTLVFIGGGVAVPAFVIAGIAFLADAPLPLIVVVGLGGYVLSFALVLYLIPKMRPVSEKVKDRDFYRECREMSERLFAFADDRTNHAQERLDRVFLGSETGDAGELAKESTQHNDETERLYAERFRRETERLLDASVKRGLCTSDERRKLESGKWWGVERPDKRIRRVAQHFENVYRNA